MSSCGVIVLTLTFLIQTPTYGPRASRARRSNPMYPIRHRQLSIFAWFVFSSFANVKLAIVRFTCLVESKPFETGDQPYFPLRCELGIRCHMQGLLSSQVFNQTEEKFEQDNVSQSVIASFHLNGSFRNSLVLLGLGSFDIFRDNTNYSLSCFIVFGPNITSFCYWLSAFILLMSLLKSSSITGWKS